MDCTLNPSNILHLCDDIQEKISKEIKCIRIQKDAKKRYEKVINVLDEIHNWYIEEVNTPYVYEEIPENHPTLYEDVWLSGFLLETGDDINPMKVAHFITPLKYYISDDRE
tara:strand:+ start:572 stop:904 length:333 start_codon:yes stop_codon:yes gene_type:complete